MKLISILIICVLFCNCCSALICEYFSRLQSKYEEHPCADHELNEEGHCEKLYECNKESENDIPVCFGSWRNDSGVTTVEKRGCFNAKNMACSNGPSCIATRPANKGVYVCCCFGNFCNSNFSVELEPSVTTNGMVTERVPPVSNSILIPVLCVLVPTLVICMLLIAVYTWRRRKSKAGNEEIDIDSLGTPSSGITTASTPNNSLPPLVDLPHLIEMKARGRFGCVWKAQLKDSYVAVKTFCLQDKQSWLNEQEIFNTDYIGNHPNILRFIAAASRGVGVETELWLITEFHELGSLGDYLKAWTVSLTDALRIMESMATGLAFLHEDILYNSFKPGSDGCKPAIAHRDFKSKNVLITHKKTAIIADFGLAVKFIPGESPGETHGQVGTRRYMAPEILEGAINFQRDAFLRIDIYAFALVLWEVVTRCSDAPGGASPMYQMPYEEEIGQHPTIEEMQDAVVDKKIRPRINHEWTQHPVLGLICETIEECWDHDVEARLSAGCVEERLRNVQRKTVITLPDEIPLQTNSILPRPNPGIDINEQNHINAQKNELNTNEETRLIGQDPDEQIFVEPSLISYETETNV